jgi:UDP:flavonoid glycosyltransferase YjiC (YdhE family)
MRARVAWSGVGIDLATNEPTPQALREAVRTVLENPTYRGRASSIADEFGGIDTRSESFGFSTSTRMLKKKMACGETTR